MVGSLGKQNQKRPTKLVVLALIFIVAGALSLTAIWNTLHGLDPFTAKSQYRSYLMLLAFLGVVTVVTTVVPAKFLERHRAAAREVIPAPDDPRTESENRRELFDSLNMEIKRSNRTRRPFAFLRVQIDGLNRIDSEHGHLVADRAVCRLAQVLRANCRELDTVVRYGGDEFAIVIPEAGPETVRQVTRRIRQRFVSGRELPQLLISIGAVVFGEDGKSIDTLMEAADRDLRGIKDNADTAATLCA